METYSHRAPETACRQDGQHSTFRQIVRALFASAALALFLSSPGNAGDAAPTASEPAEETLGPRDLGARYGQALGVIEICHGTSLTEKAKALEGKFQGEDLETFRSQAAKVFDSWRAVKACSRPDDPNQCKIMMDASCAAASREIGPKGSAVAGLVEFKY